MRNPIQLSIKSELPMIILILISVMASFWFYQNMPEMVPTHWGFNGQADGWSSSGFAAFFFPVLILGIYLLMITLPSLDPRQERYAEFIKPFWVIRFLLVTFLVLVYFAASLVGVGYDLSISKIVSVGVGLLFVILGNYLGKIKPNWFVGIRTPWTLSNEEVWNKTHRLGGKLFIILGLFFIFSFLIPISWIFPLMIGLVLLVSLGSMVYSYILYRKLPRQ